MKKSTVIFSTISLVFAAPSVLYGIFFMFWDLIRSGGNFKESFPFVLIVLVALAGFIPNILILTKKSHIA